MTEMMRPASLTDGSPADSFVEFGFRPWVRRAGLSIVLVAAAVTAAILLYARFDPAARFGWIGERFVWVYVGTLWLGGLKIALGTLRPIAVITGETITLRPLHALRTRTIAWSAIRGIEQMIGGDRLIVYHEQRGLRFVALNLNLVKSRREFLGLLESRLRERGFEEKIVERSRYLTRPKVGNA